MNDDEILRPETHALYYAEHIPEAELTMLPAGGHFVFLTCNPLARVADLFIEQFNLCGYGYEVDRKDIQRDTAAAAVEFFDRYLNNSPPEE